MRVRFTTQMLNSIAVREKGEEITNKGQMDGVGWPLYFHLGATVCALINYRDRQKGRQGQAEQLSKSRNKLLATTYKPFSRSLYIFFARLTIAFHGVAHLQGPAKKRFPGCENFVLAVAYHFCLALPEKFSQPGNHSFAGPCKTDLRLGTWKNPLA